jgi:protein TonB
LVSRRVRLGSAKSLLVSLFIHGIIAVVAIFMVVWSVDRPADVTAGEEGAPGDEGRITVLHRAPRVRPPPKEPVPEILPETPKRLLASAPSSIVLPQPAPPAPAALPVVAVSTEPVSSAADVATAKPQSRHRSGSKGTGEKGRGRLTQGNGTGTAAPTSPRLLTQTAPDYPAAARRRGAQGVAWVKVQVSGAGSVEEASLYRSCGHADLDDAAVRTAKRWHFAPATAGGHAVSAAAVVKVAFVIGRK